MNRDELDSLLCDHGGLDGLARELGQHDPVKAEIHGPDGEARPSTAPLVIFAIILAVVLLAFAWPANAATPLCGDRTGPGYRGPDGQCVSWRHLAEGICGCQPPLSKCTPERVHAGAERVGKLACKL